ncbi:MAG: Fic family protein [Bacteriovoracales bacterium]|nr:Fic family protein [Bacteriovoracales bacterium]
MKPYRPNKLPLDNLDYRALIGLVGEANAQLAEYNGLLQGMLNPVVMLSPLTNQEAVLSSKIEGTQATEKEVLEHEVGERYDENKNEDIREILNYRKTLMMGEAHVRDYGLSLNLILQLHENLMNSVRGRTKSPGEFRKDQNWIGPRGCTLEEASFVPPSPLQLLDYMRDWEDYLRLDDFDRLAQSALMHAQFELLHPFKDGNGRIGRLLIPLFLFQKKKLIRPMFYLSSYLERNRDEYYARLNAISSKGDWMGWITFYLKAVSLQAKVDGQRVKSIMKLYEETKNKIINVTRSRYSGQLLDLLFKRPIFRANDLCKRTGMPRSTAHGLLRQLEKEKLIFILRPSVGRKSATFIFERLLEIAEGR